MSRRYFDVEQLADEMVERPGFYGLNPHRQNPCCYKDRGEISFNNESVAARFEDIEEASIFFNALARAIDMLWDVFRADPNSDRFETGGPCHGCIKRGDIDPGWLIKTGTTLEELRAEVADYEETLADV